MYNSIHYKFHNLYLTKYISYVLITNMKNTKYISRENKLDNLELSHSNFISVNFPNMISSGL